MPCSYRRFRELKTNEEKNVTAVVAALDRGVLVACSLPEVDVVVAPGGVLHRFVAAHGECLG